MKLIAGLGNPGNRYSHTRHNAGFMVIDALAENWKCSLRAGKGDYEYAEHTAGDERILLLKPTTYMNNSGLAIREIVKFYKIPLRDSLIICDDAALPLGKIRLRPSGSDGGQNGLKSVIYHLNSDQFPRLRIGIGTANLPEMSLADFVLSRFSKEEEPVLSKVVKTAAQAAMEFTQNGIVQAMNTYNALVIE
ncbi:aminoacyl-tRNA hydrolase [bacterium]|nr:aminoacyl-tRNA hydrolase [bacterium]